MITTYILWSLLALLAFGLTDFTAGVYTKKTSEWNSIFLNSTIGLAVVLLMIIINPSILEKVFLIKIKDLILLILSAIANFLAISFLIFGMKKGHIGILSSIASSYSVVIVILAFTFLRETFSTYGFFFFGINIFGIILTSYTSSVRSRMIQGAFWGIAAMAAWGIAIFILVLVSNQVDYFTILLIYFLIAGLISIVVTFLFKKNKDISISKNAYIIFLSAVFEIAAYIGLNFATISGGKTSVIGAISGSYAFIPVVLSIYFLHEKISYKQTLGIFLIIFGILGVTLYG